ncbi:hypothetical protein M9H77_16127 [Catharanthus roseus]|uniref:Uncharacterized protein n=1 Tax=Catharanthus roseus TaxID=4058 RepID=A0ACC0B078_CATRO|nr:hypothetical protein M9H77_16127 [Catharanthus roseus]
MDKSKRLFLKSKRFFHRCLPPIQSRDRIDYRYMSLISRFITRILSLLLFLNNEKQFERNEPTARTTGLRTRND